MALQDPLPVEAFADLMRIASVKWQLQRFDELSGLGSGDVLAAQLSAPKWTGDVALGPMYHAQAAQVQALVESLDGPMRSFMLYAPQLPYPQSDPAGEVLGSGPSLSLDFLSNVALVRSLTSDATIDGVGSDNKSMRLRGLPPGYVLTVGDFLAFDYGVNPVRRAFHRIMETVTVGTAGHTTMFEVRPHFRPGVAAGLPVVLRKPAAKVFLVPGSFDPGTASGVITSGMSFQVMQRP